MKPPSRVAARVHGQAVRHGLALFGLAWCHAALASPYTLPLNPPGSLTQLAPDQLAELVAIKLPSGTYTGVTVGVNGQTCSFGDGQPIDFTTVRCTLVHPLPGGARFVVSARSGGKDDVSWPVEVVPGLKVASVASLQGEPIRVEGDWVGRTVSFHLDRWYLAKVGVKGVALEGADPAAAAALTAWTKGAAGGTLIVRLAGKNPSQGEQEWHYSLVVPEKPDVAPHQISWTPGAAFGVATPFLLAPEIVDVPTVAGAKTVVVSVLEAGKPTLSCELPAPAYVPAKVATLRLSQADRACGALFGALAAGPENKTLTVEFSGAADADARTARRQDATRAPSPGKMSFTLTSGVDNLGTTEASSAGVKLPPHLANAASVVFQAGGASAPWHTARLTAGVLVANDAVGAHALSRWTSGQTTGVLSLRMTFSARPFQDGRVAVSLALPAQPGILKSAAGDVATLSAGVTDVVVPARVLAEVDAFLLPSGLVKTAGILEGWRGGTSLCAVSATQGQPVRIVRWPEPSPAAGETELVCPALFGLGEDPVVLKLGGDLLVTLRLAPAIGPDPAPRGDDSARVLYPKSPDVLRDLGLDGLIEPRDGDSRMRDVWVRAPGGPWLEAWLDVGPYKGSEPPLRAREGGEQSVTAVLAAWRDEAGPRLPLRLRTEIDRGEVERTIVWGGLPGWCSVSPTDPDHWALGRALPYRICFDTLGEGVRPVLQGNVPILDPNQPIAVVVRGDATDTLAVSLGGKVGFEAGGVAITGFENGRTGIDKTATAQGATSLPPAAVSVWHFAPRSDDEAVLVKVEAKRTDANAVGTMDLVVRPVYASAIRVGVAAVYVPKSAFYDVAEAEPGSSVKVLRQVGTPFVPELVIGYSSSLTGRPRDDLFPPLVAPNFWQSLGWYGGVGLVAPSATDAFPVDFLTSLHVGIEYAPMPGFAITPVPSVRRGSALRDEWDVGEVGPADVDTALRPALQGGYGIILNVSPRFFRFARMFPSYSTGTKTAADVNQ